MKKFVIAVMCVWALMGGAEIAVSDVQVFSGFPWKDVAIGYTISDPESFVGVRQLEVSVRDEVSGWGCACKTLDGVDLTSGRHVMKWRAQEDGVKVCVSNAVFTVKVISKPATHCVIDLSGGPTVSNYPVAFLTEPPSGGFDVDEFKTTKLVLRRIEAGTFIMGYKQANEAYRVTISKPFFMGMFEVTQKQWSLVMGTDPCERTSNGKGNDYPVHYVSYDMIRGRAAGSKWPDSSAVDATSFLGKLREKTGFAFDLPTEAQWEYACRAGTSTTYYWGDSMNDEYAWYDGNSGDIMHPVGMKCPNTWGLYDMSGNVKEWTLDKAEEYGDDLSFLPYGMDPKGASWGSYRIERGGWSNASASACTSSYRFGENPSRTECTTGFRLAKPLNE